jgi:murein DD-endopeptidase MepM/ murein hydrolase activator NlpD
LGDFFLDKQDQKQDTREYTIKIIPHHGETVHSIRLPIRMVKYGLASLCVGLLLFVGAFSYASYSVYATQNETVEVNDLRQVNSIQQEQLLQLAKKANGLQDEMDKLSQMENELRQISGAGTVNATDNEGADGTHDGQGGPWIQPDVQNVSAALDNIEKNIAARKQSLEVLKQQLKEQQNVAAIQAGISRTTPSIWPASGDVSSPFGMRWGGSDFHPGIDIANDSGTPIVATADGVVTAAGWNSGGYGNMVDINHGNGIMTRYGHARQVVVSVGQQVKRGQIIAYMGSTGFSTGPHVHYEVQVNGQPVNPVNYL